MPDIYARGEYDLAGFCVGVVERKHLIDGQRDRRRATWCSASPPAACTPTATAWSARSCSTWPASACTIKFAELGGTVGEALLTPTRIYARAIRRILQHYKVKNVVHGIAHITGGGLRDNLERILPENTQAVLEQGSLASPAGLHAGCKNWAASKTRKWSASSTWASAWPSSSARYYESTISRMLNDAGLDHWKIGEVVNGPRSVIWKQ